METPRVFNASEFYSECGATLKGASWKDKILVRAMYLLLVYQGWQESRCLARIARDRRSGQKVQLSQDLIGLATLYQFALGHDSVSVPLLREGIALAKESGQHLLVANACIRLGNFSEKRELVSADEARELFNDGYLYASRASDLLLMARARQRLANLEHDCGNEDAAKRAFDEYRALHATKVPALRRCIHWVGRLFAK